MSNGLHGPVLGILAPLLSGSFGVLEGYMESCAHMLNIAPCGQKRQSPKVDMYSYHVFPEWEGSRVVAKGLAGLMEG